MALKVEHQAVKSNSDRSGLFLLVLVVLCCAPLAHAGGMQVAEGDTLAVSPSLELTPSVSPVSPSQLQDSVLLSRATSAVMPPDGLVALSLGGRLSDPIYLIDGYLKNLTILDYFLRVEAGLTPWLHTMVEVPFRSWSGGEGWIPDSGSGLGDVSWQLTSGRTLGWKRLHGGLSLAGNIPTGGEGLTEDAFSPQVMGMLSAVFLENSQFPQLRLHLNVGYRWNKAEDTGYGMGAAGLQPWYPRYQSATAAGGNSSNDYFTFATAIEFRKGTTAAWVEYRQDRFPANSTMATKEMPSTVSAGMRWGVIEGYALNLSYIVNIAKDDLATAWDPAYPDLQYVFAVSRQFGFGGHDTDGDGIVDRHDHCVRMAEDIDGYQDDDGCPDCDNDGDGIPDRLDGAPDGAEDFDGFMDEDGIPDWDNDGDGINDEFDECPDQAEDYDGHYDDDGCPDDFLDRDGDGVEDQLDGCPDEPEDMDGFEDDDGCPERDNDLDGIDDVDDKCPDDAEDYDGHDDDDGCPEDD